MATATDETLKPTPHGDGRNLGSMVGQDHVAVALEQGALVGQCAENGLLISVTADSVVRLLPPLIMTAAEADEVCAILCPLINKFLATAP